jgi:uncharacterized RDD family membrane protein YckC
VNKECNNNDISSKEHIAAPLNEQETRKILTPFAFEIDRSLFGISLAKPWQRAMALLIDFFIIALLSDAPGELLAFVIAVTLYRLGNKKRAQKMGKVKGYRRRACLRFFAALIVFSMLSNYLPQLFEQDTLFNTGESIPASTAIQSDVDGVSGADISSLIKEEIVKEEISEPEKNIYSLVTLFKGLIKDLGLEFGWAAFYFTALTALWHGQTLGKKLLKIRVLQLDGTPLSLWDSFGRYGGYGAGIATGMLGFIQIYWDPNRQAIHDKISATVVVNANNKKSE